MTCESQLVLSSIPDGITGLPFIQLLIAHQMRPWITHMRLQGAPRPFWQRLQGINRGSWIPRSMHKTDGLCDLSTANSGLLQ